MRAKRPPRRNPRVLKEAVVRDCHIAKRQRGETHEHIGRRNGISVGSVAAALKMPFPGEWPTAKKPTAKVAPIQSAKDATKLAELLSPEPETMLARLLREQAEALEDEDVTAERQRLTHAILDAETPEQVAELRLAVARLDPFLAHHLDVGDPRAVALDLAGQDPFILSRPQDIAALAIDVTAPPFDLEREDGETIAAFRAEVKAARDAHRGRAVQLLADASAIVMESLK